MHPELRLSNLLPHLAYLQEEILKKYGGDESKKTQVALELEQLPYAFDSTCYSLIRLLELTEQATDTCLNNVTASNQFVGVPEAFRKKISFNIDSFFDSARRTQNAVIPYISRAEAVSMPMSLNDLARDIKSRKKKLDAKLEWVVAQYWEHSGKKLKDYRDLLQHHAILYPQATAFKGAPDKKVIMLLLPNNPEIKSFSKLSYENPTVHAIQYMTKELYSLLKFCYLTTRIVTKEKEIGKLIISRTIFPRPLIIGNKGNIEGIIVGSVDDVKKGIVEFSHELRKKRIENGVANN